MQTYRVSNIKIPRSYVCRMLYLVKTGKEEPLSAAVAFPEELAGKGPRGPGTVRNMVVRGPSPLSPQSTMY